MKTTSEARGLVAGATIILAAACGAEVTVEDMGTASLCLEWGRDATQPSPPPDDLGCYLDPAVGRDFELNPERPPDWQYVCVEDEGERPCPPAATASSSLARCFVTEEPPEPGVGASVGEFGTQERLIETCGPDDEARGACCYWVDLLNKQ